MLLIYYTLVLQNNTHNLNISLTSNYSAMGTLGVSWYVHVEKPYVQTILNQATHE